MKKIIMSIAALVVAAAATLSMVSRSESDSIFVANVDALAEIETGEYTCYNSIKASESKFEFEHNSVLCQCVILQ